MKKFFKTTIFLFLIGLVCVPLFADAFESAKVMDENGNIRNDVIDEQLSEQQAKDIEEWNDDELLEELDEQTSGNSQQTKRMLAVFKFSANNYRFLCRELGKLLNRTYVQFNNIHNRMFGMSASDDDSSSLPSTIESISFANRLSIKGTGKIFRYLLSIFVVAECFILAIRILTTRGFKYEEIVYVAKNVIFVMILFYFLPFLPNFLTRFAFRCAEIVTDCEKGSMSFSRCMSGTTKFQNLLADFAKGFFAISPFQFTIFGVGVNGTPFGSLVAPMFACGYGGLIISFVVGLQFIIRCIDLFISNVLMCMVLPMAVFTGFGEENGALFKKLCRYYFVNMVEIFIGAVVVLVTAKLSQTVIETKDIFSATLFAIAIPLIQSMIMPATSKILSSLLNGSISDNNADAAGAVRSFVSYTGAAALFQKWKNNQSARENEYMKKNLKDNNPIGG